MKTLLTTFTILILFSLSGCSKSDDSANADDLLGKWMYLEATIDSENIFDEYGQGSYCIFEDNNKVTEFHTSNNQTVTGVWIVQNGKLVIAESGQLVNGKWVLIDEQEWTYSIKGDILETWGVSWDDETMYRKCQRAN